MNSAGIVGAALCLLAISPACDDGTGASGPDAGEAADALEPDGAELADARPSYDAAPPDLLSDHRERLLATLFGAAEVCAGWDALHPSARSVFLTLTHRLFISSTPNGSNLLENMTTLHAVLGGGSSGTECGGIDNNRLFLSMNEYAWHLMEETWNNVPTIGDGGGTRWSHTGDLAGPHAPFDASNETDAGLRCLLLLELPDSKPPTAQGHFFLSGNSQPIDRGNLSLAADPYMFEIDHDFDCLHQSNPECPGTDFAQRYASAYGDYGPEWTPRDCFP